VSDVTQASRVSQKSSAPGVVGWFLQLPVEARLTSVLCALAVVLRLLPLQSASTDYDEGVYWQSLRALSAGHPLFTSIFSSQPPFFLLSLYPIYSFFSIFLGPTLAAARLGIILYSLVGLAAMYVAARMIGGRWVGLLALALLAADPFYLKESYTLQAEVPAVAWQLVALALAVTAARSPQGRRRHLLALAAGVALGLGILVKLFDVFVLVPMVLYLLAPATTAWSLEGNRLRFRGRDALVSSTVSCLPDLLLLAAGCTCAFLLVLLPFAGNQATVFDQVIRYHLEASSGAGHTFGYNVKLVLQNAIEYPLMFLAFLSVVVALTQRLFAVIVPLLWALVCLAFLLKQQPLLDHDRLLLMAPLVLLASFIVYGYRPARSLAAVGARGFITALRTSSQLEPEQVLLGLSAAILLVSLFIGGVGAHRDAVRPLPEVSVAMSSALKAATLPGELVASDDQYLAGLADRNVPPELVDTSQVRILSGYLKASELESIITRYDIRVILFASGRFDMIPGFSAWVAANFTKIADFGDGRALYMKQPHGPQQA
jgi:4-amino-4-deoxy-L-arabinose transferase-like glycosyltransferase